MIYEDYVNFETAKLLKEKGFDKSVLNTQHWYDPEGRIHTDTNYSYSGAPIFKRETCFSAPTTQMAVKWIETEGYVIYPYPIYRGKVIEWRYNIWFDNSYMFLGQILEFGSDEIFETREKAYEAAIKHCLEKLL